MKKRTLEGQLRDAARKSGLSMLQISKRTGLPYAVVHRFLNDPDLTITLRSASKLAVMLGYELRATRKGGK